MTNISEQISSIEEEIRKTPYHKGTEHYIGKLRAKLAKLKDKLIQSYSKSSGGGGGGYAVRKQGNATVVLVGPPSTGKSTLINKLTNADSKVASYEFTTLSVIPGMMFYKNAYIQIFDIPGLIEGAQKGKGKGKEVLSVTRSADLLLLMTDVDRTNLLRMIIKELYDAGIRVNETRPDVRVQKKLEGGLEIKSNIKQDLEKETIKEIALEYGLRNAEITLKQKVSIDQLIDSFSTNRTYLPALFVINKIDKVKKKPKLDFIDKPIFISAEKETDLKSLKERIWEKLQLVTVYLVKEDEKPNFDSPIIMREKETLKDVLLKLGSSFEDRYEFAKIWGKEAKYPGQEVPLKTHISEGLQIRFI